MFPSCPVHAAGPDDFAPPPHIPGRPGMWGGGAGAGNLGSCHSEGFLQGVRH